MKDKSKFYEDLVNEVKQDFFTRREERRSLELQWNLNLNYYLGNQYCEISPNGEVKEEDKYYYWQNRSVYNHIAPIMETRLARLQRVRPTMSVRARGSEDCDLKTAKISTDVLNATSDRLTLGDIISKATLWSETLGTSFYKVAWDSQGGNTLGDIDGKKVKDGDVFIEAVSPFEIFPDSLFKEEVKDLKSLIRARAVNVDEIEATYGVKVEGKDIDVFTLSSVEKGSFSSGKIINGVTHNSEIVIERYEKPSKQFENGRVITIAGDKLLTISELPYKNGVDGERCIPFIKQCSTSMPGCFFGVSVIERVIPLQRAFNAVKNRKHEFLNRVSMGIVAVEDGSIDTDDLIEEGLQPGKVIVYRQGSTPPKILDHDSVPFDFTREEERLENEFITISGVSEISRNSNIPKNVTSGVALQLLIEQDETRLSGTAENIRSAIKEVGKHILRLYKQFAGETRLMKIAGKDRRTEVFYFNSSDISSDDVVFDTENELSYSPAQKKSQVYDLLNTELLKGEDGKLSERTKGKLLEILGFGSIDNVKDLTELHLNKAGEENLNMMKDKVEVEEFDDHNLHIQEHTRFLLSGEIEKDNKKAKQNVIEHIKEHKKMMLDNGSIGALGGNGGNNG